MSVCLYCQKELVTRKIQGRKSLYCSKTCIKKSYKTIKTDKQCKHCFEYLNKQQVRNGQKYCSKVCADSAIKAKVQKKKYRYICKNCGDEYIAKSKERNTYCSRACSFAYITAHKKIKQIKEIKEIICKYCHKKIKRGIYCSSCRIIRDREYASNSYIKMSNKIGKKATCKECGVEFTIMYRDKHRTYCSDICCKRQTRRIGKAMRRARERNAPCESIDPLKVFRQSNYVCYLCGENTNPELRGTIELNAPELDHVIPLAAGGHHVISNVRCACRKCNIDKSDKLITM